MLIWLADIRAKLAAAPWAASWVGDRQRWFHHCTDGWMCWVLLTQLAHGRIRGSVFRGLITPRQPARTTIAAWSIPARSVTTGIATRP